MTHPRLRMLMIEDSEDDAQLVTDELRRGGFDFDITRIESAAELASAMKDEWSIVMCDYRLPVFDGITALRTIREAGLDTPFVLVSGTIGEELAVEAMRAGAADYIMKSNLTRLAPVVRRELADAERRREQRRLETVLAEAQERFRMTFEQTAIGVVLSSPDTVIIDANAAFAKMLGRTREELIGMAMMDITHPDDLQVSHQMRRDLEMNAIQSGSYDKRYLRKDGSTLWVHVTLAAARKPTSELSCFIVMVEDITLARQAEEELRARDAQLALANRIAKLGSWQVDLRTGTRHWTQEMFAIGGVEPWRNHSVERGLELVHPEDLEAVRSLVEGHEQGTARPLDFRMIIGGETRYIHSEGEVVRDADGTPLRVVGYVQDVTEQKRVEAELRRRSAQQHAVAALGHAALSFIPLEQLFELACTYARNVLGSGASVVALEQVARDVFRVAGLSGEYAVGAGDNAVLPRQSCCGHALARRATVTVNDALSGTMHLAPAFAASAKRSAVAAPVATGTGRAAAVLAAHSPEPFAFDTDDVNFIEAMANILAQAIDQRAAEEEMRSRAAEQVAVAAFATRALSGITPELLEDATVILRELLHTDISCYFELDESGDWLDFRAGTRWRADGEKLRIGTTSHAGFAISADTVVQTPDYSKERRFANETFVANNIASGMYAPVRGATRVYGAIGVLTRTPHSFTAANAQFLRSIANALGDTIERDRAQHALIESEERLRTVVDNASDIIYTVDAEGRFTSFNKAFTRVTGLQANDWLGRSFDAILPQWEHERALAVWESLRRGEPATDVEIEVVGSEGKVRRLSISAQPVKENGQFAGAHCFARDITLTRSMQKERDQLTRDMQLLLESTDEGIVALDLEGYCTLMNGAAARMLGVDPADVVDTRFHDLVHDHNGAPCAIELALGEGEAARVHDDTFRRGEASVPVDYAVSPIIDESKRKGVVLTFTNTTERRKLEAQLEQADRLSALGRLAATIAHEFNNVLMGISPFIELLKRTDAGEKRENALVHIGNAIKRGKRITQEILRYTHPVPPVVEPLSLDRWMQSFLREMRSLLGSSYTIDVRLSDPSLHVMADHAQIHQLLSNLVLNARDAMKEGGRVTIAIATEDADAQFAFGVVPNPDSFVHMIVQDEGCGIPAAFVRHVFEPLFTTKRNGTGLGLAVAHQVVQQHHGSIFVESTVGAGTKFHIFLPRAHALEHAISEPAGEVPYASDARRTILLVEDDDHVAEGLRVMLEVEGCAVDLVTTGREVLPSLEQRCPDVVVLDVGLPDIDGTRVFADIARHYPALPVVFSTGHGDERKLDGYLGRSNVAMLLKPYGVKSLLETIDKVMTR